jgi:Tfp pilus assembly protein PilE
MFCPQCGKPSDISAKYCLSCGHELPQPEVENVPPKTGKRSSGSPEEFFRAVVGPKNQDGYLRHFLRFEEQGKAGVSWHWPAFFVTFYWLLYRKMWLYALIYFLLPYLVMVPIGFASAMLGEAGGEPFAGIGYGLYLIGVMVLPALYANAIYYRHCKKKIAETRSSSRELQRQFGELSGKGGTSGVVLIVFLAFVLVALIGILAAIAIPAYQDYTTRARLNEAVSMGNAAASAVAGYYSQHQEIPGSLDQAGFAVPPSSSVRNVSVDSQNGVVSVTMAEGPVAGKTLLLIPSLGDNNRIDWECKSEEIQDRYLPRQCRRK